MTLDVRAWPRRAASICSHKHWRRHAPYIIQIPLYAVKLWGAILQKNYSEGPGFNSACSYLSFLLSIKMFLLSVRIEVWTPPAAGERRGGGRKGGWRGWGEDRAGGRREDRRSLVEFTHHITAANRNPQSISDIFIIPVKFY